MEQRILATGLIWYIYIVPLQPVFGRLAMGSRSDQLVPMPLTHGRVVGRRADASLFKGVVGYAVIIPKIIRIDIPN